MFVLLLLVNIISRNIFVRNFNCIKLLNLQMDTQELLNSPTVTKKTFCNYVNFVMQQLGNVRHNKKWNQSFLYWTENIIYYFLLFSENEFPFKTLLVIPFVSRNYILVYFNKQKYFML